MYIDVKPITTMEVNGYKLVNINKGHKMLKILFNINV
jgi:hypothetical protein